MARLARAEIFDPTEVAILYICARVVRRCFLLGSQSHCASTTTKRCSDKGVLAISERDYLELLDATARIVTLDKRRFYLKHPLQSAVTGP